MVRRFARTLVTRLEQASDWTPELREYAIHYLLARTNRVSIYEVLDAAGLASQPQSPFKTDNVRLLVDNRSPQSVAAAWQSWRTWTRDKYRQQHEQQSGRLFGLRRR